MKKKNPLLDIWKGIRKPSIPPTKVMNSTNKKIYNRKDKSWKKGK